MRVYGIFFSVLRFHALDPIKLTHALHRFFDLFVAMVRDAQELLDQGLLADF